MGSLLGLTIGEVRALPQAEFKRWKAFYMLEPWGWQNEEYLTGLIVSTIVNTQSGKRSNIKRPKDFMRDMAKLVLKAFRQEKHKAEMRRRKGQKPTDEELQQLIHKFDALFGVDDGHSSNDRRQTKP